MAQQSLAAFDPYDLWASPVGVAVKKRYYNGQLTGKIGAVGLGTLDWLAPKTGRRLIKLKPKRYPITVAQDILRHTLDQRLTRQEWEDLFQSLRSVAVDPTGQSGWAWGLGFPWMSKNGLYGPDIPFVTHTPYVMEALLALAAQPSLQDKAMQLFHSTWQFLKSLKVMEEAPDVLALSYAPVIEPRIVVNANAYAAVAFALHGVHGREGVRLPSMDRAMRLARWVILQQQDNGSWSYYADKKSGNFVDCFHSCFVVKNLLKVVRLIPECTENFMPAIERGWTYIRSEFYDNRHGLCRRFAKTAQRDPFRWDLYDQAEYLGLLVDFDLLADAHEFQHRVESCFQKGKHWYCRVDIFGRCWGENFLRWGIMPFWHSQAKLTQKTSQQESLIQDEKVMTAL